jgi:hypothetical protein
LDLELNKRSDITGCDANFFSFQKNNAKITKPNTIKQITFAELQLNVTPPNSSPSRRLKVAPIIAILPIQSIALSPARIGVGGVGKFKNRKSELNASPEHGTTPRSVRI